MSWGTDVKLTTVIVATLFLTTGAVAQTLREAGPPAEFPPASFKGKQYVDSKGCVYIRAGIDGNVRWVPRVSRTRKLVCGYKPTLSSAELAKVRPSPVVEPSPPVILTLEPQKKTKAKPAQVVEQPAKKRGVTPAKPVHGRRQTETDVLPETTRVVRRHVYESRQNTQNVKVPHGYKSVWTDDRLNPNRTIRTLKPTNANEQPVLPRGYQQAWKDDRLNSRRAVSSRGEAAMNEIWTQTLPRQLVQTRSAGRSIQLNDTARSGSSPYWVPPVSDSRVTRLSTRSAPQSVGSAKPKPVYLRVADFADADKARDLAQRLSRQGLPVKLGKYARGKHEVRIVLAGPFRSPQQQQQAVSVLKRAGFSGLALLK